MPYVLKSKITGMVDDPDYVHCVTEEDFIRNVFKYPKGTNEENMAWIETVQNYIEENLIPEGILPVGWDWLKNISGVYIASEWNEDEQSIYREKLLLTPEDNYSNIFTKDFYEKIFGKLLYTTEIISFEEMTF